MMLLKVLASKLSLVLCNRKNGDVETKDLTAMYWMEIFMTKIV